MLDKSQDTVINHLDNILESGVDFEISDVIRHGYALFKKSAGKYIFFILVILLIYLLTMSIPLGQAVLNLYVMPAMMIGSMYFCYQSQYQGNAEFGTFFSGFKFFKEFLPANVFIFVLLTLVSMVLVHDIEKLQELAAMGEANIEDLQLAFESIPSWKLAIAFGGMLLIQFFSFYTNYFIGVYRLDTLSSLKYSVLFTLKKGGILLVFHIVMLCLLFSSLFLFIVGVFIVAGLLVPMYYISFLELTDYSKLMQERSLSLEEE